MVFYRVEVSKKVRKKDLKVVPPKELARIVERIKKLAKNPYPSDAIRLKGRQEYRIRQGNYRILYIVEDEKVKVLVVKVGHRKKVYRK
jgi:mRNA interferase RelE/StbE